MYEKDPPRFGGRPRFRGGSFYTKPGTAPPRNPTHRGIAIREVPSAGIWPIARSRSGNCPPWNPADRAIAIRPIARSRSGKCPPFGIRPIARSRSGNCFPPGNSADRAIAIRELPLLQASGRQRDRDPGIAPPLGNPADHAIAIREVHPPGIWLIARSRSRNCPPLRNQPIARSRSGNCSPPPNSAD